MGYLKSISRLKAEDNIGGLQQIKVCRKADIIAIPDPVDGVIYGDITFATGAGFVTWDVSLESARLQSKDKPGREGASKSNDLPFSVPKNRSDLTTMFLRMENDEFIVLYVENGKQKLFGMLHAPVLFSYSHDSGGKISDLNAYDCKFYYDGPDNVFFYPGGSGTPPAGPAPAVVLFNGVAIASLAPGETLHIVSDYSLSEYFTTS